MADIPETRYAASGDVNIAYQVFGGGAVDLVLIPGFSTNVEFFWEEPHLAAYVRRLGAFARVIVYDPRGMGLSDRLSGLRTLEERMDDLRAVTDVVGCERVAIWAQAEAGAMSVVFATTFPERVQALVLYGAFARLIRSDDYPIGWRSEEFERAVELVEHVWGQGMVYGGFFPERMTDPRWMEYFARFERQAATPRVAAANLRMMASIDVRRVLPAVRVPTLVMHHTDDPAVDVEHGRYLAEHIPDARLIEVEGHSSGGYYDDDTEEPELIEEFLTGTRTATERDRVLATVLFTDIVGSTEHASELGDRRWRALLEQHDRAVRAIVERDRGRIIKFTGDGVVATFDGPARAIRCARQITRTMADSGISIRSGLHAGEIELVGNDIAGITVHIAARVAALAATGQTLVSRTVVDLVAGSNLTFTPMGDHELKGIAGKWALFGADNA